MAIPTPQPPSSASRPGGVQPNSSPLKISGTQGWPALWQRRSALSWALWPVSQLYRALMAIRAALYQTGVLHSEHPGRPVIVVGNVVAGGSGKTPVVMALVQHLQSLGLRPGVVSRGYGRTTQGCLAVLPTSVASEVGDEPLLIAQQCRVPVYVASKRTLAARTLLAQHPEVDVLVCDDGLQHLALQRNLEICVFNPHGTGNGFLLPAGPLREPWPRRVDWVLYTGDTPPPSIAKAPATGGTFGLQRHLASYAVAADGRQIPLSALQGLPVHAVAAIGQPGLFFGMLQSAGLTLATQEALPDHYDFDSWQRLSDQREVLVCTEKDAVKLWKQHPDALAVPLQITLDEGFLRQLKERLTRLASPLSSPAPFAR
ncbi:MAG: tetraacyldisaccharide 4'-kinase [Acidovorax sp.]|nr:tetraacyldisaccharide 4'-kinase [Acidovorax sp.]